MAEAKKFPTPAMLKARKAWAKKPEAEKEAFWQKFEDELSRYYDGHPTGEERRELLGLDEDYCN